MGSGSLDQGILEFFFHFFVFLGCVFVFFHLFFFGFFVFFWFPFFWTFGFHLFFLGGAFLRWDGFEYGVVSWWVVSKRHFVEAPKPNAGPHKLRECLPLIALT